MLKNTIVRIMQPPKNYRPMLGYSLRFRNYFAMLGNSKVLKLKVVYLYLHTFICWLF